MNRQSTRTHVVANLDDSLRMGARVLLTWELSTLSVIHVIPHARFLLAPNGALLLV